MFNNSLTITDIFPKHETLMNMTSIKETYTVQVFSLKVKVLEQNYFMDSKYGNTFLITS